MSRKEGIRLKLTKAQVNQVLAEVASLSRRGRGLLDLDSPRAVIVLGQRNPQLSKSVLVGLMILISFPENGGERTLKAVSLELGVSPSTVHRYARTLVTAGLLKQNPATKCYRRAITTESGAGRGPRQPEDAR